MHTIPAYITLDILLRSSGGAHVDSIATIDGQSTPYVHNKCTPNSCILHKISQPDRQWRSSSFQESKKVRVSRDLWPWPWPWAHPGCMLTRRPPCASLVAIRPFVCEKKRFAQKFTDGRTDRRTDDGRSATALAHSWNELKIKPLASFESFDERL